MIKKTEYQQQSYRNETTNFGSTHQINITIVVGIWFTAVYRPILRGTMNEENQPSTVWQELTSLCPSRHNHNDRSLSVKYFKILHI